MRILTVMMLLTSTVAQAQVYKCVGPDGRPAFSDRPCGASYRSCQVDSRPNSIDTSGAREQALKRENERLREQLATERTRAQVPSGPVIGRTRADLEAEKSNSRECAIAKRNYEFAASSIANKGGEVAAAKRGMYSACGMREPDNIIVNNLGTTSTGVITHCVGKLCYDSGGKSYIPVSNCRIGAPASLCR